MRRLRHRLLRLNPSQKSGGLKRHLSPGVTIHVLQSVESRLAHRRMVPHAAVVERAIPAVLKDVAIPSPGVNGVPKARRIILATEIAQDVRIVIKVRVVVDPVPWLKGVVVLKGDVVISAVQVVARVIIVEGLAPWVSVVVQDVVKEMKGDQGLVLGAVKVA